MDLQTLTQLASDVLSSTQVSNLQFYGLMFLLGSFTVASLSDIKRMAAQREFAEVWLLFTIVFFAYDFYRLSGDIHLSVFAVKWAIIGVFALVSWKYFGLILSLSEMDLTAACAAMSLMNPVFILIYYLILVIMKIILRPILSKFGDGISMPFMPVILSATFIMMIFVRLIALVDIAKILS